MIRLVFSFLVLIGCENQDADRASEIVLARIGTDPITLADYQAYVGRLPETLRDELDAQRILQGIIDEELIMQEVRDRGLDRSPELAKYLQQQRRSLAVRALYQREGIEQPEISEEELRTFFARSPYSRKVRYSLLMVETPEMIPKLLEELAAGADFEALSMRHSRDRRILARGADMGFHRWGGTAAAYETLTRKAYTMEPGEVAGPLQVENGYFLIKLTDVHPIPFAEERERIEQLVIQERLGQRLLEYYRRLQEEHDLQCEAEGFAALVEAATKRPTAGAAADTSATVLEYDGGSLNVAQCLQLLDNPRQETSRDSETLRRRLDYQVGRQLLVPLEIERLGMAQTPPVVEQLERERRKFVTRALRAQIASRTLPPSQSALLLYFDDNRERYARPDQVEVRRMLVPDRATGEDIVAQLHAGLDTLALVDRFVSVTYGGGALEENTPIGQALRAEEGSLHGPLATSSGYIILQIIRRQPARLPELEEVQNQVMADFARDRIDGLFQTFIEELRSRYAGEIQMDQNGLHKLVFLENEE